MFELPKNYEPQAAEEKWYADWLAKDYFKADPMSVSEKRPAYSIVIPPPNVTGVLTLGHVLNVTIQDILARRARMLGKEVLWLPGTDHAGIATQTVVERTLKKAKKIRHRDDLGRDKFLDEVWKWKDVKGGIIIQQLKKLGASCDWSRERFTMDEEYSRCVQKIFVNLYKKGLIYRGKRMVNWCPVSLTAISDEEVVMKPQNGVLYYFKVEVDGLPANDEHKWLTIATTRPETIPGDTAIAVNPKDERYAHLIGKMAVRALPEEMPREQRLIPIIGDEHVDFEFGTGVLKVTPAHDKADFEIGARHSLTVIDIMNPDGTMNALAGESLAGLDRFEARKIAIEKLRELDVLVKEEPHQNNVGFSERADVPIEPRLSEQWFLKYPSVEEAKLAVSENQIRFFPERWEKVYEHWLNGIQDWCISRQLWWGHRIPVWRKTFDGVGASYAYIDISDLLSLSIKSQEFIGQDSSNVAVTIDGKSVTSDAKKLLELGVELGESNEDLREIEAQICTIDSNIIEAMNREGWVQDPDVLDTWFSSWLWPFATMGWTGDKTVDEQNAMLRAFYPTTDLVTGPDIIFFWVARMIMAGYEWMDDLPFRNVYFTGIIRDKQGRKMSKSLGNSPDPLDIIAKFGADALRFGVMRSAPLGADILFDEKNVELGRNFCTKLWNAARFRQMQGSARDPRAVSDDSPKTSFANGEATNFESATDEESDASRFEDESLAGSPKPARESRALPDGENALPDVEGEINAKLLTSDDKWILLRLDLAISEVSAALDEYRFSDAAQTLYRFFWSEFCDWYLETSKAAFFANDEALKANTLAVIDFILAHTLRLMHPFLPFITEELWHGLGFNADLPAKQGGATIMLAHWPQPLGEDFKTHYGLDDSDEAVANAKYETVLAGRGLRRDANIASNKRVRFVLKPNAANSALANHDREVLRILLNAEEFAVSENAHAPEIQKGTPTALTPLGELFLPLEGLVDVEAERERLKKEVAKVESELAKVRAKLANPNFTEKVPAAVLEEHRQRETNWQEKLAQLKKMRDALKD